MRRLLQYVKENNAFAKRDYWIAVPTCAFWLAVACNVVLGMVAGPRSWIAGVLALVLAFLILSLPLTYHRWSQWVIPAFFVTLVLDWAVEYAVCSSREVTLGGILAMAAVGVLAVVTHARRFSRSGAAGHGGVRP